MALYGLWARYFSNTLCREQVEVGGDLHSQEGVTWKTSTMFVAKPPGLRGGGAELVADNSFNLSMQSNHMHPATMLEITLEG